MSNLNLNHFYILTDFVSYKRNVKWNAIIFSIHAPERPVATFTAIETEVIDLSIHDRDTFDRLEATAETQLAHLDPHAVGADTRLFAIAFHTPQKKSFSEGLKSLLN